MMQHHFCKGIGNTSIVPEEDVTHWTILGEGGPLLLLVLGPRDEIPPFLVFRFPLTLKRDRSTTNVGT